MVNEAGEVRVIDFGFSMKMTSVSSIISSYCGTPAYMSPEIVKKTPHQPLYDDIWALGVVLLVLLTGKFPFKGNTETELY